MGVMKREALTCKMCGSCQYVNTSYGGALNPAWVKIGDGKAVCCDCLQKIDTAVGKQRCRDGKIYK